MPSQQDYRTSSTAPEMYSLGYQHPNPSEFSNFPPKSLGYGSLSTRTATPGPSGVGPLHSMQTPRSFEEMGAYSYDGDGDVVMADLEDLKAIMDVMHHVHEKRFKDDQIYQRDIGMSKVRSSIPKFALIASLTHF